MSFNYDFIKVKSEEELISKIKEGYFYLNIKRDNLDNKKIYTLIESLKDEDPLIMNAYGIIKMYGIGCEEDYDIAITSFLSAEEKGVVESSHQLGLIYKYYAHIDIKKAINYFELSASKGLRSSMYELGNTYFYDETLKDEEKALNYFKESANLGYVRSVAELGYIYYFIKKDYEVGLQYLLKGAENDNIYAINNLGAAYEQGIGVEKNISLAIDHYKKASLLGHKKANSNLARLYLYNNECYDLNLSYEYLMKSKEYDINSLYYLGYLYQIEKFEKYDIYKSIEYYEEFLKHDKTYYASHELAQLYLKTDKVLEAIKIYEEFIETKPALVHFELGLIYSSIKYNVVDYEKAFYHYTESANLNNYSAMNNLAVLYEKGLGCEKDLEKAFKLYEKTIVDDSGIYYGNLGLCYLYGRGTQKDYKKAFELFTKATEKNYLFSYKELAQMYKEGLGVPNNILKAKECYDKIGLVEDLKPRLDYIYTYLFDEEHCYRKKDAKEDNKEFIKKVKKHIKELEYKDNVDFELYYILGELYFQLANVTESDNKYKLFEKGTDYFKKVYDLKDTIINHKGLITKYGKEFYCTNLNADFLIYDLDITRPAFGAIVDLIKAQTCGAWALRARLLYALNKEITEITMVSALYQRAIKPFEEVKILNKEIIYPNGLYVLAVNYKVGDILIQDIDIYQYYLKEAANRYHNNALFALANDEFDNKKYKEVFYALGRAVKKDFPKRVEYALNKSTVLLKPGEKPTYHEKKIVSEIKDSSVVATHFLISIYGKYFAYSDINRELISSLLDVFLESAKDKEDINNAYHTFEKFNRLDEYFEKFQNIIDDSNIIAKITLKKDFHKYVKPLISNFLNNHNLAEVKQFKQAFYSYLPFINYDKETLNLISDRLFALDDPEECGNRVLSRIEKSNVYVEEDYSLLKKYASLGNDSLATKIKNSTDINLIMIGHDLGYQESSLKYFEYLVLENKLEEAKKVYPNYINNPIFNLFLSDTLKIECNHSIQMVEVINSFNNIENKKTKEITKLLNALNYDKQYNKEKEIIKKHMLKYNEYSKTPIILLGIGDLDAIKYLLINYFNDYNIGLKICDAVINMDIDYQFKGPFMFNKAMFMYETGNKKEEKKALQIVNELDTTNKKYSIHQYNFAFYWKNNVKIEEVYLKKVMKR